jgi:hypothetical protein
VCYQHGDHVIAAKKGINILERGHQVNVMAEFQEFIPKLSQAQAMQYDARDARQSGRPAGSHPMARNARVA